MNRLTTDQIRTVLATLSGYWPTPAMTEEEVVAWTIEMCGPYPMSCEEIRQIIDAEKTREWRPRPGELVVLVQRLRRQDALRAERHLQLVVDPDVDDLSQEQALARIAECRQMLQAIGR